MQTENKKNPYQDTLNLKTTEFPMRANSATKEPEILKNWDNIDLYTKATEKNKGKEKFILHDGPPYANGSIHMGHLLNKVLKDVVTKFKRMSGYHVNVRPGWDCHGLPIELKVVKEAEQANKTLDKVTFKKSCRDYVNNWQAVQKKEFIDLGVIMDWKNPYMTMNPRYEADILRSFSIFVEKGFIERKGKTVPWCASCKTVLATAEIEYEDRKDPSIYVQFDLLKEDVRKLFKNVLHESPVLDQNSELDISFLVWTTTPWTLPLNRAVVLNPDAQYCLLKHPEKNLAFIVASDLADNVCSQLKIEKNVLNTFESKIFLKHKVCHPFIQNLQVPIILDYSVSLNDGTACVHSAPGCGPEDYILGVKNGLEIYSPLSEDGRYTKGIEPKELENMPVADGQFWVLKKLTEVGKLLHKSSITHSYPHCWRCHNGLIFRATEQWFCDLQKNDLAEEALKEIEKIQFIPDWGKARFRSFISNRTEWCISRQRSWGVPITSLICKKCDNAFVDKDFIETIANGIERDGIEYWDKLTLEEIFEKILHNNFSCSKCGNKDITQFIKETDILDVWFDSGVSHFAVLAQDLKNLSFPADLYLEGSDQHRGWFQSSLLSSMILNNGTPTKAFLTHGFVVDEKGHKMSKSVGNVVAPQDIIKKFSRDISRLWVAGSDFQNDIAISENILKNMSEVYRKIRNTCRFIIANIYDFDVEKNFVEYKDLLFLDKIALSNLYEVNNNILKAYSDYNFSAVIQTLNNYCANDLSALYLDIVKDRLYIEKTDSLSRRSAQTTIYVILDTITRLMAPVLSFLAEEVSDYYQKDKKESIHLQEFLPVQDIWSLLNMDFDNLYWPEGSVTSTDRIKNINLINLLEELRTVVLKAIEQKRVADMVKHSLEVKVKIFLDGSVEETKAIKLFMKKLSETEDANRFFKDWFIVSQFEFVDNNENLEKTELSFVYLSVEHASGVKCPRCWQWSDKYDSKELCPRCVSVLE